MLYLDYQNNKYLLGMDGGWYAPKSSHLHFLKLSSTSRPSISYGKACLSNSLLSYRQVWFQLKQEYQYVA